MACPWSDRLLQDPTIDLIISPCFLLAYLLHHFAPEAAPAYLPTVRTQCTNMYEAYRILLEWSQPENHSACSTRAMRSLFWPVWHGHGSPIFDVFTQPTSSMKRYEKGKVRRGKTETTSSEINIVIQEYSRHVPSILIPRSPCLFDNHGLPIL